MEEGVEVIQVSRVDRRLYGTIEQKRLKLLELRDQKSPEWQLGRGGFLELREFQFQRIDPNWI